MVRLKTEQNLDRDADLPKPCEVFDMICGTSTGGYKTPFLTRRIRELNSEKIDCHNAGQASHEHQAMRKRLRQIRRISFWSTEVRVGILGGAIQGNKSAEGNCRYRQQPGPGR